MIIRFYKPSDQNEVCKLHEDTVRNINDKDYSKEQIETWPGILDNYSKLGDSLMNSNSYVAVIADKIVGFGDISNAGHISRLYPHKDFQGLGIGSKILSKLEEKAKSLGLKEINLESTISAKSFYQKKKQKYYRKD